MVLTKQVFIPCLQLRGQVIPLRRNVTRKHTSLLVELHWIPPYPSCLQVFSNRSPFPPIMIKGTVTTMETPLLHQYCQLLDPTTGIQGRMQTFLLDLLQLRLLFYCHILGILGKQAGPVPQLSLPQLSLPPHR